MAKACLEMAVLDAHLRFRGRSFAEHLGIRSTQVETGAVVGLTDQSGLPELLEHVQKLAALGYSRVKVKIAPGSDTAILTALRNAFPVLGLQADANGAYCLSDPSHRKALDAIDDLALLCIEQPLDPDDLAAHRELAATLKTPVCLDESITSLGRLRDAISLEACDMVCIKPSRLGGLLRAVEAHDICREASIPVWCGGMLETAFARSANATLSCLPGFTLPGDLEGGVRFRESDPFLEGSADPGPAGPTVAIYSDPGVGPAPDPELLDRVTTRKEFLRA
jgi:O-succinylbenzoate synthase